MRAKEAYLKLTVTVITLLLLAGAFVWASSPQVFFSGDPLGQEKLGAVAEGQHVYVCVFDPDWNVNPDERDSIVDSSCVIDDITTGARLRLGGSGTVPASDFVETGADTGLFVNPTSVQIGARRSTSAANWTHSLGSFAQGSRVYLQGQYQDFSVSGRIENMDTIIVRY